MPPLPARQIHLDFHTSEHIPDVGSRFDPRQFQAALCAGHVNLINIFAKGHHGWSYYPTKIGHVHPTLEIDLLGGQIAACHEIGVRAPVYYTVGWSVNDADAHPEWCLRNEDGTIVALNEDPEAQPDDPRPYGSWKCLCPSGEYLAHMLAQSEEICQLYDVDGFWYDICFAYPCYCDNCRRAMGDLGVDVSDRDAVFAYSARKWKHFMGKCTHILHSYHPGASIYFNGTTQMEPRRRNLLYRMYEHNSQQDLEDLPTTWGGYDKLPVRARFFANTGKPLVAMSGKFHTSWGEFGGFKHPDAIRYEAASMIAYGAAPNFGDQLHPLGEMDMDTYRSIGEAFEYVEQIEEYGPGGHPASNLGLWLTGTQADDEGTVRMLLEIQADFCVVDPEADLSVFDAIVLTGAPGLTQAHAEVLSGYVAGGGALLVLGESALGADKGGFLLDVGATYLGPGQYDVDYVVAGEKLRGGLISSPFLVYDAALRVQPDEGTQVLAAIREPYFSRTYARFCSHRNTPYRPEEAAHPAALRTGQVVFLPHRLGKVYYEHGARLHRDLFAGALGLIYTNPAITTELPSAGRVSLMHQPEQKRYVAHLLYGPPLQRGNCLIIEDLVPLHDIPLTLRVPDRIRRAYLVPSREVLDLNFIGQSVSVTVPVLQCHQAVVFEY